MKTILNKNPLVISRRIPDLAKQDLDKLIKKLPEFKLQQVTFPLRGLGKPTLYPSSWRRFPVKIAKTLAVEFDDLQFLVTDGGGKVSTAHDSTFDPANPHIVLLAGARAGTYKVVVLAPVLNNFPKVVGQLEFVVDGRRANATGDGPPLWIDGQVKGIGSEKGQATWGEPGDNGNTGQVYPEVVPAIGIKRVLVLLVDTASDRYPAADIPATLTNWRATLSDGLVEADTVKRSVRAFYEEMSYYVNGASPPVGLTLETRVDGPISLPGTWEDHFPGEDNPQLGPDPTDPEPDVTKKKQIPIRRLYYSADHLQAVVDAVQARNQTGAADQQIDLASFDILCCVIRTVRPAVGTSDLPKSFWPRRQYLTVKIPAPTAADPAATQDKNMDPFNMPDDWPDFGGRTFQDTVCHEFGHSIRLGDLYTPAAFDVGQNDPISGPFRNVGGWDTMAWEEPNPHFSLVSRLKLGWVKPDWLKRFNFLVANDVDETFTISAAEKGSPPPGSFTGAEIRIGSNWNYYVEYRSKQTGQIGDNHLPSDARVVCTDAIAQGFQATSLRPEVMLLWTDTTIQSDGPVLGPGQSYLEQDPSGNGKHVKISVLDIKNGLAKVRVQYKVFGIDLGIRPWPAGPNRPWQSPDIEVRNEKSKKDPDYFNTAWTGNVNEVVAKITNAGTVDAPKVAVMISVKEFNVGGDTPVVQPLAKIVKDVAAGATVDFVTQWIPPKDGHFCLYAEILPYATAGPPLMVDMNPGNSVAQSNYSTSNLAAASPTERTMATVKVGNPHDKPTIAYLVLSQSNPFYRTYLSNRWIRLEPKEVRDVTVMMESRLDWDDEQERFVPLMSAGEYRDLTLSKKIASVDRYIGHPNQVAIAAYMPNPTTDHMHVIQLLGGAQLQARSGRKVQILGFLAKGNLVAGRVATTGVPFQMVKGGQVIVTYSTPSDSERAYLTLPVVDGSFRTSPNIQGKGVQGNFKQAQAYYVPNGVYGEAYSEVVQLS
jgi:hypothetical protein